MALRHKVFAVSAFVFCGLALAFLVASFASPYWVQSEGRVNPSGFERMGLWEACFHEYYPTIRPIATKRYNGCWPAISYELKDLYDHFYPAWMRAVQGMVTMAMLQELASVILNIIYFIHCFSLAREQYIVLVSSILNFLSAFWCTVSTIMFGVKVHDDRQWLPHPDSNYLSWAYGFCILAAILCLFSGMCAFTDFFRLRLNSGRDQPDRRGATYAPDYTMAPAKYRY